MEDKLKHYFDNAAENNCYSLAVGSLQNIAGHPGAKGGMPLRILSIDSMDQALKSDGLIPAADNPEPREEFYLVAAVYASAATTGRRGYHFYRQMDDGSWWHKPGKQDPTNLDVEGKPIINPIDASRDYTKGTKEQNPSRKSGWDNNQFNYNIFSGYYYAPITGLEITEGTLPESMNDHTNSGNWAWKINNDSNQPTYEA